ncbi:hypothetical protein CFELI_02135 [Corynebacterium felinum]|nr:hypothetical protein CFELI_02135 [Corynebacterium felinum]
MISNVAIVDSMSFQHPAHTAPRNGDQRRFQRRVVGLLGSIIAVFSLAAAPQAAAQPLVPGSSDLFANAREAAWNTRVNVHRQVDATMNPIAAQGIKSAVDNVINVIFPGLIEQKNAAIRAEQQRIAEEAAREAERLRRSNFDYGSCPKHARACIDLAKQRTWLQKDGVVQGGAVPMSSGAPGWETPKGTHRVLRKVRHEVSYIFDNAPMPYSIYFTTTGVAFHEGDVNLWSHGCIHLNHQDAVTFWNNLHIGDVVYVY